MDIESILTQKVQKNLPKEVTPSLFFGQLMQSQDVAKLCHLNTKSYAEHMALGGYYDKLNDLTDDLIETYQGSLPNSGRVNIVVPSSEYCNFQMHLTSLRQYISSHRYTVFKESHLQNIVDEIVALIDKTNYLLTLS